MERINQHLIWSSPPLEPFLPKKEIHIWRVSLTFPDPIVERFQQLLADDEIERARRLYFARDRTRFIIAHGVLRTLLGCYIEQDPRQLHFSTNAYGKPYLTPLTSLTNVYFNMSHSHELALFAFSRTGEVGIDIEYMRNDINYEEIASYAFSPNEQSDFWSLLPTVRQEAFFNCWTRKEAYIKARGKGLSLALNLFDVSLVPGSPAALLASREDSRERERWSFTALYLAPQYTGTLVASGRIWQCCCWDWSLHPRWRF